MDTLRDELTQADAIDLAWSAVHAAKAAINALVKAGVNPMDADMVAAQDAYEEALEALAKETF